MTVNWLSRTHEGYRIAVQVSPNAKRSEIVPGEGDALRIRLQAQPIDGKANEALIRFIAQKLGLPRRQIAISHGLTAKRKLLFIAAPEYTAEEIEKQLKAP